MNTQLLDTLKEKWTKKSTKIACASVGTAAVLGIVGALIACNVPLYKQVVAEDGTVTTVQTQQKESHGLFDIFHAPTEQADAAQNTTTEITPPQTNADGTPINTPTAAPGTPQAAASGSVDNATGVAAAAPVQASGDTPAPAAVESSPALAEESPDPAPAAPQEMPRTNVHGGVYMPNINCYKVIDDPGQRNIPEKAHYIPGWLVGGKFFDNWEETREYANSHRLSTGTYRKKIIDAPGQAGRPVVYHYETLEGKRISPNITGNVPA
ncbi:Uncharacterised protein [Chlamydia trachomatis]|nr:Uncharacterised protein [Chlamydia trachomatis]